MPTINASVRDAPEVAIAQRDDFQPIVASPVEHIAPDAGAPFQLLLALDDDSVARAAVRVTASLARECGAVPTVVKVIELGLYLTPESLPELANAHELILAADTNHEYRDELLCRVATLAGHPVHWRAELDVGCDVRCIVHRAEAIGAQLIVMGLEHHGAFRRALVGDTVRQVITSCIAPVLAVTKSLEGLPGHIVVGMDFTPSSIRAAHWARKILAGDGLLELVYVDSGSSVPGTTVATDGILDEKLEALIRELALGPMMRAAVVRRRGFAADQLCTYAREVGADLIALGSHRYKFFERLQMGSVSTAVVHNAQCSVLVTPPDPT